MLPNVRKLFLPDEGYIIFDADLQGADAYVVAWDSGDEPLKTIFREGRRLHAENAKVIFGSEEEPYYSLAKRGVHATNYGCKERTLAVSLGITIAEAQEFQAAWFAAHPAIKAWHERIQRELHTTHSVRNAFGYRRYYFDRLDSILPEALAWIPQSTVACITNRGLVRLDKELPGFELLMQVHDSIVGQFPVTAGLNALEAIRECMRIPVPYPDPLTIPVKIKTSDRSWGACV